MLSKFQKTIILTKAQKDCLCSLVKRNGTGIFDQTGVLVAAGQRLGATRLTWSVLTGFGFIEKNGKRLTVTPAGEEKVKGVEFTDKAIEDDFE